MYNQNILKEEERIMKKLIVVALILVLTAGVVYARGYEVQKRAGEFDVAVSIDRNPPVTGDNNVSIVVKNASGKVVNDAKVKLEYGMPAMMGMPAMDYKTDAALAGSEYKAVMNLSMSGSWNIVVKIIKAGKTASMKFTIDAK